MLPKLSETIVAVDGFTYRILDGVVHELALSMPKFNQTALNEYYRILKLLFGSTPDGEILYILSRHEGALMPFGQSIQFARDVIAQYPNRPVTHLAIIAKPDPVVKLGDTMLRMLLRLDTHGHTFRIFNPAQDAAALAWLLPASDTTPGAASV